MTDASNLSRTALAGLEAADAVIAATREALSHLQAHWDKTMVEAWTRHVLQQQGRVVVSGMGKSGLVGQKIAATLASTGCPSFFLHPAEARHGDLGMVTPKDTLLLLSNSGESEEINQLIPCLIRQGNLIGAMTAQPKSTLAQAAQWRFLYELPAGEGCSLNYAPMASTTMQLLWGDMLAAYHMALSGFTLEHFALFHPGGNIGSKLIKTNELMHHQFPQVSSETPLVDCLNAMSKGKLGMVVVGERGQLAGVISDGDVRRGLEKAQHQQINPLTMTARDVMTAKPTTIALHTMALEAASVMEAKKITFLVVMDEQKPVGVLHIHDLLSAKVL